MTHKHFAAWAATSVLALLAIVLLGCGGNASSASVASISVTGAVSSITYRSTQQFSATAYDSSGNKVGGQSFTWSSSDPSVATIDAKGVATGVGLGSTDITAEDGTIVSAPVIIRVSATVSGVTLSPLSATIAPGQTLQFTATAQDSSGNNIPNSQFQWYLSSSLIATINAEGLVTGIKPGQVVITATSGGVTSQAATLTVSN